MFYDYELFKTIVIEVKDELGQVKKEYVNSEHSFMGDVQPVTGTFKKSMGWGDEVTGELTLYSDEALDIGDIVNYNGLYEIEKKAQWDYFIYSLKRLNNE